MTEPRLRHGHQETIKRRRRPHPILATNLPPPSPYRTIMENSAATACRGSRL